MNDMEDLRGFQDAFIAALFDDVPYVDDVAAVAAIAAQPGFSVYRNTVLKGCVDNLAANFPTVLRLVGEPWFRGAALEHARCEPPRTVSLFDYGAAFPDFLADFPPASELPYLADVARLDKMWIDCHTAADAPALTAASLAGMAPESLGAVTLTPHPATRWLLCRDHPAAAIWIANRERREIDPELPWHGDSVMLTRLDNAVQWQAIEFGAAAFLDACAGGAPLQDAAAHALSVQPELDIAATLATLLQAGAFHNLFEKA